MKYSVLTCTHNPTPEILNRAIEAVRTQVCDRSEVEHLVIDNGSTPPVQELKGVDLAGVTVLREEKPGKVWAKIRGVEASSGELVVIVDDDNILEGDYLVRAGELMDAHPFLGILGGVGTGEFDKAPPAWMHDFLPFLGINQDTRAEVNGLQYGMARRAGPWLPIGAGMVMRRAIAQQYADLLRDDPSQSKYCRTGKQSVFGGTDTDVVYQAINGGWACGLSSRLKYGHVIPSWRFELRYMERLLYAMNYGVTMLVLHHGWKEKGYPVPQKLTTRLIAKLSRYVPMSPARKCWIAKAKGFRDAINDRPFDPYYE